MILRAVVFDFDGVLLDSEAANQQAWRQTLEGVGISSSEWLDEWLLGRGDVNRRSPSAILASSGHRCDWRKIHLTRRSLRDRILATGGLSDGAVQLVQSLRENGICCGIASSGEMPWIQRNLRRTRTSAMFDCVVSAAHLGLVPKPSHETYMVACRRLRVASEEAIAVEDSLAGVHSAMKAGMKVAYVGSATMRSSLPAEVDWLGESLAGVDLLSRYN